jgi:hypothetical protein
MMYTTSLTCHKIVDQGKEALAQERVLAVIPLAGQCIMIPRLPGTQQEDPVCHLLARLFLGGHSPEEAVLQAFPADLMLSALLSSLALLSRPAVSRLAARAGLSTIMLSNIVSPIIRILPSLHLPRTQGLSSRPAFAERWTLHANPPHAWHTGASQSIKVRKLDWMIINTKYCEPGQC